MSAAENEPIESRKGEERDIAVQIAEKAKWEEREGGRAKRREKDCYSS